MSNLCIAGWHKVKMQFIYNHNATERTIIFKEQVCQSCNKLFSQSVINMFRSLGIKSYLVWLSLTFCKIKCPSLNICSLVSWTAMEWDKKKYSKTGKHRIGSSRTSNVSTKQFTSGVVGKKGKKNTGQAVWSRFIKTWQQSHRRTVQESNRTHQDKGRAILVLTLAHIGQKSYNFKKFHLFIKDGLEFSIWLIFYITNQFTSNTAT